MALIMIIGLALLIYAQAERQLRLALEAKNEKIPDQKDKPTFYANHPLGVSDL